MNVSEDQDVIKEIILYSTLLKSLIMGEENIFTNRFSPEDIGFTMKTMLISCYFNGKRCGVTDFKWTYSFEYSNCYTFNHKIDRVEKTRITGPNSGLTLELYVGRESNILEKSIKFIYIILKFIIIKDYKTFIRKKVVYLCMFTM